MTERRWVEFALSDTVQPQRGYENAANPGPIDKAAEMVLASTQNRICSMTLDFDSGPLALVVLQTSDEFWEKLERGSDAAPA
jgi:hypothetical protein